jgi:hypothetical protein
MGQKETEITAAGVMIYGPKADGTYIVEFKTAAGGAGDLDPWERGSGESIRRVLASRASIGDAKGGPAPGGSSKLN